MNRITLVMVVGMLFAKISSAQPVVTFLGAWNTANVFYQESPPTVTFRDFSDGPGARFSSVSRPGVEAWAFSSFGVQRSFLSVDAAPRSVGLVNAGALAVFDDRLLVTSIGLDGRPGFGLVSYTITGSYGFFGTPSFTNIEISSRLITIGSPASATAPTSVTVDAFNRNTGGTGTGVDFLGVPQFALVPFTFGTPFFVDLEIKSAVMVNTTGGGSGGGFADLSHTMVWGGFSGVFLSDDLGNPITGAPVTRFAVTSESGTNYAGPILVAVPEPAGFGAIAAGFLILGAFLRKYRCSRERK